MTGTGTQEDPYMPDNWADFVTAVGTPDAYVTCPEGLIFDMNEIAPDGVNGIAVNCKWLDGNGLTIKNLYNTRNHDYYGGITSEYQTTICNLNIENFYSLGTMLYNKKSDLTVYNCKFSGIMQNRFFVDKYLVDGRYIWLNNCSFNLKLNQVSGFGAYINNAWFNNCNINIDSTGCTSEAQNGMEFHNCLITGSINYNLANISGSNSIIDADITHSWDGGTNMNCVLVNSDRIAEGVTIGSSYTLVTSEQIRDADYLASIGFPIGVE